MKNKRITIVTILIIMVIILITAIAFTSCSKSDNVIESCSYSTRNYIIVYYYNYDQNMQEGSLAYNSSLIAYSQYYYFRTKERATDAYDKIVDAMCNEKTVNFKVYSADSTKPYYKMTCYNSTSITRIELYIV